MSANVEPEEVEAIMEMVGHEKPLPPEVRQRDFRKPLRLSSAQVKELEAVVSSCANDLGEYLSDTMGTTCRVQVASLAEANADHIFQGLGEHFAVLRFRTGGQLGWVVWDIQAALSALESIFGSGGGSPEARHLTRVEGQVLGNLLASVATAITDSLGMETDDFAIVEDAGQIGDWRDGGVTPDAHRLHVAIDLEGIGNPSELHVYLPGFQSAKGTPAEELGPGLELPGHLAQVEVELTVRLAECEISLNQLLALEEGDVIPTSVRSGDPATILVEGKPLATGQLGTHQGRYAVQVEQMLDTPEDPS